MKLSSLSSVAVRAWLATIAVSSVAHAQHAGDIFVGLENNRVVTGIINPDQTVDTSIRAYRSTFGDTGFPGFTANPGYDAAHVFDPAFRIGFNLRSPLQYWNGKTFGPTAGETLTLSFLSLSVATDACFVPGFDLAVQADGGWHRHLSMFLNPPEGVTSSAPGIYLIKMDLYYTAPSYQPSRAYWMVFNHEDSIEHHTAALAWVDANLANPQCAADIDRSGIIDVDDLIAVILSWGPACNNPADTNDDGAVNVDDLIAVILGWGPCA